MIQSYLFRLACNYRVYRAYPVYSEFRLISIDLILHHSIIQKGGEEETSTFTSTCQETIIISGLIGCAVLEGEERIK